MKHLYCSFPTIVFLARAAIAVAGDEGPPEEVRGLRALDHYVGSWKVVVTSRGAPFTLGQATGEWILDGGFLQRSGASPARDGSPGLQFTQLMNYDPGKKTYRGWNFYSDGSTGEGEATWDAGARTMTSVCEPDKEGVTVITTADFSEAGVEKWRIVWADPTGKVVAEVSGRNTRIPVTFRFEGRSGGTAADCREASSSDGKVVLKVEGPKFNGTVRLYETATNEPMGPVIALGARGASSRLTSLAIAPDNQTVATAMGNLSNDWGKVTVWNATNGKAIAEYRGPPYLGEVLGLSFEGDGSILSIISGPAGGR